LQWFNEQLGNEERLAAIKLAFFADMELSVTGKLNSSPTADQPLDFQSSKVHNRAPSEDASGMVSIQFEHPRRPVDCPVQGGWRE